MTVLAAYSIKGGVGKTALAVNLAFALQRAGIRTLLIDLDPQGAAAYSFRISHAPKLRPGPSLADSELVQTIRETDHPDLDVLPPGSGFRKLDLALDRMKKSRRQLALFLESLRGTYRAIVLDCPPGLTLLAENVFRCTDLLLVPVIPTPLSVRTLDLLADFLHRKGFPPERLTPFLSMVQARRRLHRETISALRTEHPRILSTEIPFSAEIENMALHRKPVLAHNSHTKASAAYEALCAEILERVKPRL